MTEVLPDGLGLGRVDSGKRHFEPGVKMEFCERPFGLKGALLGGLTEWMRDDNIVQLEKEMAEKSYFPVYLDLENSSCLVVGGGSVALRKVNSLLAANAAVQVVSPETLPEIGSLAEGGAIEVKERQFAEGDLDGKILVIAATNDGMTNARVAKEARRRGIICNVVDQPELCTAIIPAVVKRGRLQIAISTSGASPAMARRIRGDLAEAFGPEYECVLEILWRLRRVVLENGRSSDEHQQIFNELIDSDMLRLCREKKYDELDALIEKISGKGINLTRLGLSIHR